MGGCCFPMEAWAPAKRLKRDTTMTSRRGAEEDEEIPKDIFYSMLQGAEAAKARNHHISMIGMGGKTHLRLAELDLPCNERPLQIGDKVRVVVLSQDNALIARDYLGELGRISSVEESEGFRIDGWGRTLFRTIELERVKEDDEASSIATCSTTCPSPTSGATSASAVSLASLDM